MIVHRNKKNGFTLIELMVVVVIIGVLAAVAIPAYQDYIGRSQMSEPIVLMDAVKLSVSEYYNNQGVWPALGTDVSVTSAGTYTASIVILGATTVGAGTITLQSQMRSTGVNSGVSARTLQLRSSDGGATWLCTAGGGVDAVASRFLPNACR